MNTDLTEIVCILDRSGSMASIRDDAIGGFNTFLAEQKLLPGRARMTVVLFDDQYEFLYQGTPLVAVAPLTHETFVPRGATALLDAVGRTIDQVGARLKRTEESERPGQVVVVIVTDGHENASGEYSHERVRSMIAHQRDAYRWTFVYLGANVDAFDVGQALGIHHVANYAASPDGIRAGFVATSYAASSSRRRQAVDNAVLSDLSGGKK